MTEKVFWQDPYRTRLETEVTRVDGPVVEVRETVFFALSGGQESDRGTIGGHAVQEARKAGRDILYELPADHGLVPEQRVTMEIDWPRRYRLMRLHFAAEIVLELVTRRFPGIEKIGAHIGEAKARIDFRWHESLGGSLPELAAEVRRIVAEDQPIVSAFTDEAGERRYWKIADFAAVPCGGTHLKRTGEIGAVALKRKNPGQGKERIEIVLEDPSVPVRA